ncbi:CRP-like cAMP-binding protein [Sphingomonas zeicaulis]|uniref:Crp/Fnr family transcriptional regulator n=1 Tax=Sphingomonas zeicaulis TaxID=1632740 RepID=UPI003D19CE4C
MSHRLLAIVPAGRGEHRPLTGNAARLRQHAFLARMGEQPSTVHLIIEGWACRYHLLHDGRRQIIDLLLPGDLCDIDWLNERSADYPAVAMTPLATIALDRREIEAASASSAEVAQCLQADMFEKLHRRGSWIAMLGRKTAIERLAYLLAEIFARLRRVGLTRDDICDFPLTQNDLADLAGLTPVHVNRVLQEMRQRGLIELHHRSLRLPDFDRLAGLGLFEFGASNEFPISRLIQLREDASSPARTGTF